MTIKEIILHRLFKISCPIAIALTILSTISVFLLSSNPEVQELRDKITDSNRCTKEKTTFTVSPIDLENIISIVPLGNLNPSGHTFPTGHMYYNIKTKDEESGSPTIEATLYAPIDATIENINVMTYKNADPPSTDYSINFRTCEDFTFYFIHATSLSDKLLDKVNLEDNDCDEYETGGRIYENCWKEVDIDVEAGEVIGTVGSGMRTNFDFGVIDSRIIPHTYANPDRWQDYEDKFYKVCSTDYYEGELKEALEEKLGDWSGNKRTIEPICGTIAQDEPETAQGLWILQGTNQVTREDPHIALVHDNFDPRIGVFSIGTSLGSIGIQSGTYRFEPQESGKINLDFNLVEPNGEVLCYEVGESFQGQDNSFSILISLTSDEILRIGLYDSQECGQGPWSLEKYIEFER